MNKLLEFGRKAMFFVRVLSGYEERRIRSYRLQLQRRLEQVFLLSSFSSTVLEIRLVLNLLFSFCFYFIRWLLESGLKLLCIYYVWKINCLEIFYVSFLKNPSWKPLGTVSEFRASWEMTDREGDLEKFEVHFFISKKVWWFWLIVIIRVFDVLVQTFVSPICFLYTPICLFICLGFPPQSAGLGGSGPFVIHWT